MTFNLKFEVKKGALITQYPLRWDMIEVLLHTVLFNLEPGETGMQQVAIGKNYTLNLTSVYHSYSSIPTLLQYIILIIVYHPYSSIPSLLQYTILTSVYHPYSSIPSLLQYTILTPVYHPYSSIPTLRQYTILTPV